MNHRLKVTQGPQGSSLDFWNFVRGLRWINPTMAPTIEQFHKMTRGGATIHHRNSSHSYTGQMWLRQSLLDHNLSNQLRSLVSNRRYLLAHYEAEAYLCQLDYLQAMLLCLHAVEQNKAALLADINPILLCRNPPLLAVSPRKVSHVRSSSLPTTATATSDDVMIRRRQLRDGSSHLVPPPIRSPRTASVITVTNEQARAHGLGVYSEESATEALRNVLNRSGSWDVDDDEIEIGIESQLLNDPLMNMQIINTEDHVLSLPKKSASFSSLNYGGDRGRLKSYKGSSLKKSKSRTADLLDNILNDDDYLSKSLSNDNKKKRTEKLSERTNHMNSSVENSDHTESALETNQTKMSAKDPSESNPTNQNSNPSVNTKDSGVEIKRHSHKRSSSDFAVQTQRRLKYNPDGMRKNDSSSALLSSSLPNGSEDDGLPYRRGHKDGVFRQPAKGQSLISFLSSQDFHTCAELDKENAHFTLAEGLISAIEQMKWNQIIRPHRDSDQEDGDSDEEIQHLKQRIRIRRRERLKEKARDFPAFCDEDPETMTTLSPTTTSITSHSPLSSSSNYSISQGSSSSSEEIHDTDITEEESRSDQSNLTTLKESGLSLSMASLYSEVEIQKSNSTLEKNLERKQIRESRQQLLTENANSYNALLSAESVAIALLSRFSEKQLPKASELEWLVSEQDAPQQLLPLPDSYPISPDDSDNSDSSRTRIRGNLEWAPPRAQIIFNIHPPPKRKAVLAKQNYRCAGCGAKVEPGYTKRYRYCEYLGKYFCPCCHSNDLTYIPGRILRRWDFTKYYVSNFSRDVLKRIFKDPLFNVRDINSALYKKVHPLEATRECRQQLHHLVVFLKTCRLGQKHYEKLEKLPSHWTNDIHQYSILELIEIKKQEHLNRLKPVVNECLGHIAQCQLCQAKGFICEVCRNMDDVIFPFELQRVHQCSVCKSCFHKGCFNPVNCPKCMRIEARRCKLQAEFSNEEESNSDSGKENSESKERNR